MGTTTTPTIVRVEMTLEDDGSIAVHPIWGGPVDRPDVGGYLVNNAALANRLKRAILAGAVYYDAEYRVDVNGKTFVSASSRVLGRMMNADLKRLGF